MIHKYLCYISKKRTLLFIVFLSFVHHDFDYLLVIIHAAGKYYRVGVFMCSFVPMEGANRLVYLTDNKYINRENRFNECFCRVRVEGCG